MLLQRASGAVEEGPVIPVGGPKLRPERYVPFSVEDIVNVLIREPVLGRKKAAGPRIEPPDGALNFGPGGVRKSVREKPVCESLSELKPLIRRLEVPLVRRETRGRVCYHWKETGHLEATGAIGLAGGGMEQRASPNGTTHRNVSRVL